MVVKTFNFSDLTLESVILYRNVAECRRTFLINNDEPVDEVVIKAVPQSVNTSTIRFLTDSDAVLRSTQIRRDENEADDFRGRHQELRYKLKVLEDVQMAWNESIRIYVDSSSSGKVEAMKTYEEQSLQLLERSQKLNKELKDLKARAAPAIQSLSEPEVLPLENIYIKLDCTTLGSREAAFTCVYMVGNVSWSPSYTLDLNTEVSEAKLHLTCHALINNSSTDSWRDTKLRLVGVPSDFGCVEQPLSKLVARAKPSSFGIPNDSQKQATICGSVSRPGLFGGAIPQPQSSSVDHEFANGHCLFGAAIPQQSQRSVFTFACQTAPSMQPVQTANVKPQTNDVVTFYDLPGKYDINHNGNTTVTYTHHDFVGTLSRACIPNKDPNVYLSVASENAPSGSKFMDGPLHLLHNGSFRCTSTLKKMIPAERCTFRVGVDPDVHVTFKQTKKETVTTHKIIEYTNTVTLKNESPKSVRTIARIQIPISDVQSVTTKLIKPDVKPTPAENQPIWNQSNEPSLDLDNVLSWPILLEPEEEKGVEIVYSIGHSESAILVFQ